MLQERLSYLLDRYLARECNQEEIAELHQLLQQPEARELITQLSVSTLTAGEQLLLNLPAGAEEQLFEQLHRRPARVFTLRSVSRIAAAAVLLLAVAGGWWLYHTKKQYPKVAISQTDIAPGSDKAVLTLSDGKKIVLDSVAGGSVTDPGGVSIINLNHQRLSYENSGTAKVVAYNTLTTPRGGQYQIVLPDGTHVWLDAASSLRFPTAFTGADRTVQLTGEAYFEVASQASQPFTVQTGEVSVLALGTSFNIMAYTNEANTAATLVQGSVKVTAGAGESVVLTPGRQATVQHGSTVIKTGMADVAEVLSWKDGLFSFSNVSIQALMRQLERWYDVDVEYEGDIPDYHFNGTVSRRQYVGQLLEILEESGEVKFTLTGNKIIVKRAKQ